MALQVRDAPAWLDIAAACHASSLRLLRLCALPGTAHCSSLLSTALTVH